MSTVFKVKSSGYWRASFKSPIDGKLKTMQLGKLGKTASKDWGSNLQRLERAALNASEPCEAVEKWVEKLPPDIAAKLCKHGLLEQQSQIPKTFAALCAYTIELGIRKKKNKKGTTRNKVNSLRHAIKFFEGIEADSDYSDWKAVSKRLIRSITDDDIVAFRDSLQQMENSKTGVMKNLSEVFNVAKRAGLVSQNPVSEHRGSWEASEKLDYVSLLQFRELYDQVDTEWQLILGLAMYAGLRGPSEVNALRWQDIHWARRTMTVRSSKLGKNGTEFVEREVPIFDEIAEPLVALWQSRDEPDCGDVITKHRTSRNESDQWDGYSIPVERLGRELGVDVWKRPMQNLRASFISRKAAGTEGEIAIPLSVICKWVGQSEVIAGKHYIVLSDENLVGASSWTLDGVKRKVKRQSSALSGRSDSESDDNRRFSECCSPLPPSTRTLNTPKGI